MEIIENKKLSVKKKPKKQYINKALRMKVWNTFIGTDKRKGECYVYDDEIDMFKFETGHVIAESNDGETNINNLKPICGLCNKSMGTNNMEEFKKNCC